MTIEKGWDILHHAKPWRGAEMVDAFAESHLRQADVREARLQYDTILKIEGYLKVRHRQRTDDTEGRWHMVDGPGQLVLHAGLFHDWVIGQLLASVMVEDTLLRFKTRVERFEWSSYLNVIETRTRGNADEHELRNRLCLYLHDRGLEPWAEVVMGTGRADGVVRNTEAEGHGVRVTFEVKCARPADRPSALVKRLRTGASQGARYAVALNQPRAFVVVFWAHDADPDIDPAWQRRSPPVTFVIVDVRRAPSKQGRGRAVRVSPSA